MLPLRRDAAHQDARLERKSPRSSRCGPNARPTTAHDPRSGRFRRRRLEGRRHRPRARQGRRPREAAEPRRGNTGEGARRGLREPRGALPPHGASIAATPWRTMSVLPIEQDRERRDAAGLERSLPLAHRANEADRARRSSIGLAREREATRSSRRRRSRPLPIDSETSPGWKTTTRRLNRVDGKSRRSLADAIRAARPATLSPTLCSRAFQLPPPREPARVR